MKESSYYNSVVKLFLTSMICSMLVSCSYQKVSLKQKLDDKVIKAEFSGVILVAQGHKTLYKNVSGFASRRFNYPNNIDTKFNLSSIGKLFTSVAIAKLIQENKISLHTQVDTILPDWNKNGNLKYITIKDLLTHQSGLDNFMSDKRWKLGADSGLFVETSQHRQLIASEKQLFKTGTSVKYSNSGYLLLGAVIEKISNQSYSDYLKDNIFSKFDMNDTGLYRMDEPIKNLAIGYYHVQKDDNAKLRNNLFQAPFNGTAAGGIYSTANDLLKFSRALLKNIYEKDLSKELLSTRSTFDINKLSEKEIQIRDNLIKADFSEHGFAGNWNQYGFAIWNNRYLGHTGGTIGATAILLIDPKTETVMIVLSNQDDLSTPIQIVNIAQQYLGLPITSKNF